MIKPAIILVKTQLAGNIGSAARAMLNFSLTDLRLVEPQQDWKSQPARSMAAGADVLLENARIYPSLEAATADLQVVYATTVRPRDMTKYVTTPKQATEEVHNYSTQNIHTGVVFGPEKSGLCNDDVALADKVIEIPVNTDFSSLNLSQAVLVMAYEWFQAIQTPPKTYLRFGDTRLATRDELNNFFKRLESALDANGFLDIPGKRDIMVRNIRNMFTRSELTEQEVRTLHGIISSLIIYSSSE